LRQACCAFFSFSVTCIDAEVLWDASVVDDDIAHAILEEFYALPVAAERAPSGIPAPLLSPSRQ